MQGPVVSMEAAIPLPYLCLVHALTNPETGQKRDVIVKKVVLRHAWSDRHLGTHRSFRMIPGLDVEVPWPRKERKEPVENGCDTPRMEVETKTWVPTLLTTPMPSTVIDELRNKYSKFRTRHDDWYIAKKTAEEEQAKRGKQRLRVEGMTPVEELRERNRTTREKRIAAGEIPEKPELSEELLGKIGEVIARNKGLIKKTKQQLVSASR